jgi:heme/copper-type cytochrome/quinol oxidase subunit 1
MGAINFIATVLNMRTPGLRMNMIPLFVWAVFFNCIFIITFITCFSCGYYNVINR